MMTVNCQNILPLCIVFIVSLSEVIAEFCDDGRRCTGGQKCCGGGCCYPDDDDVDRRYTYGYKLSIWNMWYFWFVVLFILMSCFGGCGYYKQRQRVIRNQPGMGPSFLSVFQVVPRRSRHQTNGRIVTLEPTCYPPAQGYGYPSSPTSMAGVNMAPPPYSEVVSNPDQFPVNKSGIPANAGMPYPTQPGGPANDPANQMPQPPPYTEVAHQYPSPVHMANQNAQNTSASTNQSSESH